MEYYKEFFSLEDIEKKFEEYCQKYDIDDFALVHRFQVIGKFKYNPVIPQSKTGVIPTLQNFIEFQQPIIFTIKDRDRECDIVEIRLTDTGWKVDYPDWKKGKY